MAPGVPPWDGRPTKTEQQRGQLVCDRDMGREDGAVGKFGEM